VAKLKYNLQITFNTHLKENYMKAVMVLGTIVYGSFVLYLLTQKADPLAIGCLIIPIGVLAYWFLAERNWGKRFFIADTIAYGTVIIHQWTQKANPPLLLALTVILFLIICFLILGILGDDTNIASN